MADIERIITLYHNMYLICAVLAVIFLALTVFLFIRLNIRRVFENLTGRAEKKAIKQMEEEAVFTSQLRRSPRNKFAKSMISPSGNLTMPDAQPASFAQVQSDTGKQSTESLNSQNEFVTKNDTMVLSQEQAQTSVLHTDATTVLNSSMIPAQTEKTKIDASTVNFMLERQILMINTEENIAM